MTPSRWATAAWVLLLATLLALFAASCSTEHIVDVRICVPFDSLTWSDSTVVVYPRDCP